MRNLDEIRKDIDRIDTQIRELVLERLDCSTEVVMSKIRDKNYVIYRGDREEAMLERLGEGVPEDKKTKYLPIVRKVTETSRMFQYSILYEEVPELFEKLIGEMEIPDASKAVTISLSCDDSSRGIAPILSMIADYGFRLSYLKLRESDRENKKDIFELTVDGDICDHYLRKLLLQLSMESHDFKIIAIS